MGSRTVVVGARSARAGGARAQSRRRRRAADRLVAHRRRAWLPPRRVPRAGAHDVLPPLVRRRSGVVRPLLRAVDAQPRQPGRCSTRRRASASGSASGTPNSPSRTLREPAIATTARCWSSATAPSWRPTARSTSPATPRTSRNGRSSTPSALLRARTRRVRCVGRLRRAGRHDDLQRSPLAGVVPGDGSAGRRGDPVRLQHADPLRPRPEPGHPPGLPQRPGDAVRRLPERHVGHRRRQGRCRGRASTRWPRA